MSRRTLMRFVLVAIVIGSLIGLFPLAVRFANPFATLDYDSAVDARILLLWPDRIELQPIGNLTSFSPRPANAEYSFLVPAERQGWVAEQLRKYPTSTNASWRLHVKTRQSGDQEITLELLGDGIYGVVYEASNQKIVPLKTRLAGPGFAIIVLGIDVLGSILLLVVVWFLWKLARGLYSNVIGRVPDLLSP